MLFDPSKSDAAVHPSVLKVLSTAEIEAFRGVAADLANGKIKRGMLSMANPIPGCGAACCIAGHVSIRMKLPAVDVFGKSLFAYLFDRSTELYRLLSGRNPDNPKRASRAIIHYLATGSGHWPE